jgi:hypothetical protein
VEQGCPIDSIFLGWSSATDRICAIVMHRSASPRTSAPGAIYAFSLSLLSRPFRPFIGSTLKARLGSNLPVL